jgi:uncharacterized RDD family membrane protein YckC
MNWYYVDSGQQTGPVDDTRMQELVRTGKIQPETLVWQEGMAAWQPYQEVTQPGLRLATAAAPNPGTAAAAPAAGNEVVCAECGSVFKIEDTIQYGNMRVCARCKPILVQKLAEGARLNSGALIYAGFWTRFAAIFIDWIVLWVVNTGLSLAGGMSMAQSFGARPRGFTALQIVLFFVQFAIGLSYETFLVGKYGATLGKMACKIKVVTADGGRVSFLRALGRYFAKILSGFTCLIGYIMAGFDEEKRALHDRICSTRVVMK